MSDLDDSFSKLLGRQPSDAERQQLYNVGQALGIKNNDALWLILLALQYHQTQYSEFPALIQEAARDTLKNVKEAADAAMGASAGEAKAAMAEAVADAAQKVANNTSKKQMWKWAAGCIVISFLCVGIFGWYMHSTAYKAGLNSGYGAGYAEAKDEKAAATWANTPEGKSAYKLAQAGSISILVRCNQPGWMIENGACYAKAAADGKIYGWQLQ